MCEIIVFSGFGLIAQIKSNDLQKIIINTFGPIYSNTFFFLIYGSSIHNNRRNSLAMCRLFCLKKAHGNENFNNKIMIEEQN